MPSDMLADDSVFYGLAAEVAQLGGILGPNGVQALSEISEMADSRHSLGSNQPPGDESVEGIHAVELPQETFCYRPLEEEMAFRVLVIYPGNLSQPLAGTLEHDIVRKEGNEPGSYYRERKYNAISYAWKSDSKPCSIFLDGHRAMITESLHEALLRFRDSRKSRRVWADGICINQEDAKERGAQVALMPEIYTFAAQVLVYLGQQGDGSEHVPQLIEAVLKVDISRLRDTELDAGRAAGLGLPPANDPSWDAIVKFFCRPWFGRVWIIQEVVLARSARFYCGDWDLMWWQIAAMGESFDRCLKSSSVAKWNSGFIDAQAGAASAALMRGFQHTRSTVAARLSDLETDVASSSVSRPPKARTDLSPDILTKRNSAIRAFKQHPEILPYFERTVLAFDCIKPSTTPILKLLGVFSQHKASIPRDRLFALVGLACDVDLKDFPPNYEEPEFETNARFSRKLIEKGQGMDVLYHATKHDFEWDTGFYPSWSPYWTIQQSMQLRHWLQLGWAYASHPGGFGAPTVPSDAISVVKGEPYLLRVRGSYLGILRSSTCVARIDLYDVRASVLAARFRQYFEQVSELMHGAAYFTGESWLEVECRTLIADHGVPGELETSSMMEAFLRMKERISNVESLEDMNGSRGNEWASKWFTLALYYAACRTSEGYVGLVPKMTSENDEIVMIQGSDMPFVVRPIPSIPGYHQFVGGCYMHGLMKGKAWKRVGERMDLLLI